MKSQFCLVLCICALTKGMAAFDYPARTARGAALASSQLAGKGEIEASWLNPALIQASPRWYAAFSYVRFFNLSELPLASGLFALNRKQFAAGVAFSSFGNALYRESEIRVMLGRALLAKQLWVGIALRGYFIAARNYRINPAVGVDLGFAYQASPVLRVAGVVENINQPRLNGQREEVPQSIRLAVAFQPIVEGEAYFSLEKDAYFAPVLQFGFRYLLTHWLEVNGGYHSLGDFPTLGFRLQQHWLNFQYGVQFHMELGPTHFFQISFQP